VPPTPTEAALRCLQIDLDAAGDALAQLRQMRAERAPAEERGRWLEVLRQAHANTRTAAKRGIDAQIAPAAGTAPGQWMVDALCCLARACELADLYAAADLDGSNFAKEEAETAALRTQLAERARLLGELPAVLSCADGTRKRRPAARLDGMAEARDKWIFGHCCKGMTYKMIKAELKARIAQQKARGRKRPWGSIGTIQGICRAAERYAKRHGLPRPPRRRKA
jgi:hypothetical protein